jgi:hypothetical protein
MRHDQRLDLDHTIRLIDNPSSIGDRIVHAVCNRGGDKGAGVPNPEISGVPDPATSAHEKVGPLFL